MNANTIDRSTHENEQQRESFLELPKGHPYLVVACQPDSKKIKEIRDITLQHEIRRWEEHVLPAAEIRQAYGDKVSLPVGSIIIIWHSNLCVWEHRKRWEEYPPIAA